LHRRLPKRGFNNIHALDLNEINLGRVQQAVEAGKLDTGSTVTVDALVAAGILSRARDGVKVLGNGELKSKLSFEVWAASASAVAAIEKAGGSVKILRPAAEASA
ncbi:MAG: uL15 family ribosomal protein, partial [Allorhizobium sp.]